MRITDALFGAIFVCLGVWMAYVASGFPTFSGQPYGASLLPSLLGVGFVISGGILITRDVLARRAAPHSPPIFELIADLRDRDGIISGGLIVAMVLAQIFFAESVGFIPVFVLSLTIVFIWFEVPKMQAVGFAILGTSLCWWLFAVILKVPLGRGLIEGFL